MKSTKKVRANSLIYTLGIDIIAAIASAATTSPAISIIDKAIFSNASGKEPLMKSLLNSLKKMTSSPKLFFTSPSFLWIWGVYSGTYIIANTTESIFDYLERSSTFPKFISSSAANVSLSLAKDQYFTKAFGKGNERAVPFRSIGLYGTRDCMTIFASFVAPVHVSSFLSDHLAVQSGYADVLATLITPCAIQFLSTPLHLYGMDYYNNQTSSITSRIAFIKREYSKTVAARIGRILPAFGVGNLINKSIRS